MGRCEWRSEGKVVVAAVPYCFAFFEGRFGFDLSLCCGASSASALRFWPVSLPTLTLTMPRAPISTPSRAASLMANLEFKR